LDLPAAASAKDQEMRDGMAHGDSYQLNDFDEYDKERGAVEFDCFTLGEALAVAQAHARRGQWKYVNICRVPYHREDGGDWWGEHQRKIVCKVYPIDPARFSKWPQRPPRPSPMFPGDAYTLVALGDPTGIGGGFREDIECLTIAEAAAVARNRALRMSDRINVYRVPYKREDGELWPDEQNVLLCQVYPIEFGSFAGWPRDGWPPVDPGRQK
jgi:hypothetical protein